MWFGPQIFFVGVLFYCTLFYESIGTDFDGIHHQEPKKGCLTEGGCLLRPYLGSVRRLLPTEMFKARGRMLFIYIRVF